MADVEPLDLEVQEAMAGQPQAATVEVVPGLTALVPPGADPEELRARILGETPAG